MLFRSRRCISYVYSKQEDDYDWEEWSKFRIEKIKHTIMGYSFYYDDWENFKHLEHLDNWDYLKKSEIFPLSENLQDNLKKYPRDTLLLHEYIDVLPYFGGWYDWTHFFIYYIENLDRKYLNSISSENIGLRKRIENPRSRMVKTKNGLINLKDMRYTINEIVHLTKIKYISPEKNDLRKEKRNLGNKKKYVQIPNKKKCKIVPWNLILRKYLSTDSKNIYKFN